MPRDSQRRAVYAWEGTWPDWNRQTHSIAECRSIIRWACGLYRVDAPTVVHKPWNSWYDPELHKVALASSQRNAATALHEAAHVILYAITGEAFEDHGRQFLGIYLWLLIRAGIASKAALLLSAEAAGLKWARLEAHGPKRIRYTYRRVIRRIA